MSESKVIKLALQERRRLEIYSYSMTRDWGMAEDAVQEAYVVLYRKQDSLTSQDNLYGWLEKIVHDKSIDILRKSKRFQNYDAELIDLVENSFDRNEEIIKNEKLRLMQKVLDQCMDTLNSEDLQIMQRFYLKRNSCEKIAQTLSSSVNAIRLKLSRLRAKLRKCSELKLDQMGESF